MVKVKHGEFPHKLIIHIISDIPLAVTEIKIHQLNNPECTVIL